MGNWGRTNRHVPVQQARAILQHDKSDNGHDYFSRRAVAGGIIRDDLSGRATLLSHQFLEETYRNLHVYALLQQDIENIHVLVHSTPQVLSLTSNRYDVILIHILSVAN